MTLAAHIAKKIMHLRTAFMVQHRVERRGKKEKKKTRKEQPIIFLLLCLLSFAITNHDGYKLVIFA